MIAPTSGCSAASLAAFSAASCSSRISLYDFFFSGGCRGAQIVRHQSSFQSFGKMSRTFENRGGCGLEAVV